LPDFTRPPWPEIIGFAALIAIPLAVFIAVTQGWLGWLRRRRKELSSCVLSVEPLVSISEVDELGGRLVVALDGQPAQGLSISVVVVRVWNSGTEAIGRDDFETEGFLTYGQGAIVLTDGEIRNPPARATTSAPRDPGDPGNPGRPADPAQLLLKPMLFNSRESVDIRVLVRGYHEFAMAGRIKGGVIRETGRENVGFWDELTASNVLLGGVAGVVAGAIISALGVISSRPDTNPMVIVIVFLLTIAVFAGALGVLSQRQS